MKLTVATYIQLDLDSTVHENDDISGTNDGIKSLTAHLNDGINQYINKLLQITDPSSYILSWLTHFLLSQLTPNKMSYDINLSNIAKQNIIHVSRQAFAMSVITTLLQV